MLNANIKADKINELKFCHYNTKIKIISKVIL